MPCQKTTLRERKERFCAGSQSWARRASTSTTPGGRRALPTSMRSVRTGVRRAATPLAARTKVPRGGGGAGRRA